MPTGDKASRLCHFTLRAALLAIVPFTAAASDATLERQRELFIELHPVVERGDWSAYEQLSARDRKLLQRYVLWPDLRSTWFKATIDNADHAAVESFLDRYGTLKPARELRYRYAVHLARSGHLASYLDIYRSFYQGIGMASLDCYALQAELDAGRDDRVSGRAVDLWLVGRSQADECNPVFEWIKANDGLGGDEYRKRFELALEAREFSLARWLGRSIDEQHAAVAARWLLARDDPASFLRRYETLADDDAVREQLVYAIERLTYADPLHASALWADLQKRNGFDDEQIHRTDRHIALWMARDNLPGAYRALSRLPRAARNDEVARWRARVSLRNGNWQRLLTDIELLSAAERESEEWRYWRARALARTGNDAIAEGELETLSGERSYYGFLAADELGLDYALEHSDTRADEALLANIEARPGVVRARELFIVGLEARGRSEWDNLVGHMSDDEKKQAAVLAYRWGWHSRAIATAATVGEYDDLELRYPLAFEEHFQQSSAQASISPTWAYGVARSESLFMRDVRSHAGAIGLMQLLPSTGRKVARRLQLPYNGLATLTNPESNIRLGTSYLGQMAERYGGNRVVATAAYNAGPKRVDEWLPVSGSVDARIWIENIPFNETRRYVRRVLAAETIFHWRLTGSVQRLSEKLVPVLARDDVQQLASR